MEDDHSDIQLESINSEVESEAIPKPYCYSFQPFSNSKYTSFVRKDNQFEVERTVRANREEYKQTLKLNLSEINPNEASNTLKRHWDLNLANRNLIRLPEDFVSNYSYLRSVDLSSNLLITIPTEICSIQSLRILRMDENMLSSIPDEIGKLEKLEILTLTSNQLQELNPNLANCTNLTHLVLNQNILRNWPDWICTAFPKLHLLYLQNNTYIPYIPTKFYQLKELREFGFDWFQYLNPAAGIVLKNLEGRRYISDTRSLCKAISSASGKKTNFDKINFYTFINYFMPGCLTKNNMVDMNSQLHMAAYWGHHAIVKELEAFLDLNALNIHGENPLIMAIKGGHREIASNFIKNSIIDLNITTEEGTALHLAIKRAWYDILLEMLSTPNLNVNIADEEGCTLMHYLFESYSIDKELSEQIGRLLINSHNADCNSANNNGLTPLHCAARKNQKDAIYFALTINSEKSMKVFDFNAQGGMFNYILSLCEFELTVYLF